MGRLLFVKLGMDGHSNFEGETVCGSQSISKNDARDESTLDPLSVFNGDIASINERLLLNISLTIRCGAASEQGDQGL